MNPNTLHFLIAVNSLLNGISSSHYFILKGMQTFALCCVYLLELLDLYYRELSTYKTQIINCINIFTSFIKMDFR